MQWYEGGIEGAVKQAHATKALFCVAILGSDSDSSNVQNSLESPEVQSLIVKEGFVFIRIEADSPEHVYFTQLYPGAGQASIYCISNNGTAVEVILSSSSNELVTRLVLASARHQEIIRLASSVPPVPANQANSSGASTSSAATGSVASCSGSVSSSGAPSVIPDSNQADSSANSAETSRTSEVSGVQTEAQVQASLEERIERAKRLAAAKQQKKLAEEAEENKRREFERREAGRGAAELKRWQEEQEAKKLVEERRKDKLEDAVLRQRIKDQIAQDRIDRQARVDREAGLLSNDAPNPSPPTSSLRQRPAPQAGANYSGQARLQFRLPDGSTQANAFEPDTTLGDVRKYLLDNSLVPYRDFSIWVAFPRREFSSTDYSTSLRDLGLLPSAALLILPAPDHSILSNASQAGGGIINFVYVLLGYLLYPLNMVVGFLRPALAAAPTSGPRTESKAESRPTPRPAATTTGAGRGNVLGGSGVRASPSAAAASSSAAPEKTAEKEENFPPAEKRPKNTATKTRDNCDGNVHRLRTAESDSDDEKATWNGNSTQQM